jgi:flagellar protein FliO/FliZ
MVARQQLSRNASIGVVRVLDRAFVVGITEQQLSVLAEMDAEAVADALEEQRTAGRAPARTPRATQMTLVDGRLVRLDQTQNRQRSKSNGEQADPQPGAERRTSLNGSALSPQTWRQTVDAVRGMTGRNR